MHKKIYYQDEPISKFKNDKIGFQEEVRMLKEGLNGNSKVIGLIADYGSGKSSVINLLENNTKKLFWNFKYKFVRINLFDIEKSSGANLNENIEAQKKMVLQLASSKYKNGKSHRCVVERCHLHKRPREALNSSNPERYYFSYCKNHSDSNSHKKGSFESVFIFSGSAYQKPEQNHQ